MTDTHTPFVPTASTHWLICGHGYLGKAIASLAAERGHRVSTCSRSGDDADHACDLGSASSVAALAATVSPPDVVVHCASSGKGGAEAYEHVYLNGIRHLHDVFPDALILFTSSSSVYGQTDGSLVTEDSPALPDRETGRLLLAAEHATIAAKGIVCRLSGIYGPARSVILKKFLSGQAIIEEDGRRFLNQIHRDDAARAILLLGETPTPRGEIYNVSDSMPLSQRATYEGMAKLFSLSLPPSGPRDENRKRGWTHKQVSNEKLRSLGWELRYPGFLDAASSIATTL
jgi:nucleoside-diphosphate-sugar epimerase